MTITIPEPRVGQAVRKRMTGDSVAVLLKAAAQGHDGAWKQLVDEFGAMIRAIARAHRLAEADAADVAQATWLRLLEHLGRLNDPTRVGAWLATTSRRECLRTLGASARSIPFGDDAPEFPCSDRPPDDALLLRERDEALWGAVNCLRAGDQALLRVLMADPRPSYEEIAAALDMPIGSIGPTRQRALERLRGELVRQDALSLMTA